MSQLTFEDLFLAMAHASTGTAGRVAIDPDADPTDIVTRIAVALNVVLEDLEYRHNQAKAYLEELLEHRTRTLREAEEGVRRREEFISIAAHELRSPLTSLRLVLEGTRSGMLRGDPDQQQRALELAERQVRKLSTLVDRLLGVARSQSGIAMVLERRRNVDLGAIVHDAAQLLSPELRRSGSTLSLRIEAPVVGWWDQQRLGQVVANLLGNAIKFGAGKPIDVFVTMEGELARLVVTDGGIGIAADRLPHIFERFERGVSPANFGGFGLGLYIVHEIVTAHGGTLRAESELGGGSRFEVELPSNVPDGAVNGEREG